MLVVLGIGVMAPVCTLPNNSSFSTSVLLCFETYIIVKMTSSLSKLTVM